MEFRLKFSTQLSAEMTRLLEGSKTEKERYRLLTDVIRRVQGQVDHAQYIKTLPDDYRAADVGERFRLFFKVFKNLKTGNYIYFAWINDESALHTVGSHNDAYAVFSKMVERGAIEAFVEDEPLPEPKFTLSSRWGTSLIYASLEVEDFISASATLVLLQKSAHSYEISDKVSVYPDEELEFAKDFLRRLCREADAAKITLCMEIRKSHEDYELQTTILSACGFKCTDLGDEDLWERP